MNHPDTLDLQTLVGLAGWSRLPLAVRRRFGPGHPDTTYTGHLDLQCSKAGRCFAGLAGLFGAPLAATCAQAVPAHVRVHPYGRGGVVWERRLALPGRDRVVRSTKQRGPGGTVIERTDGGLSMLLDVFEEDRALVFRSRSFHLALGRWRIPVPAWLTPGVCRVEHRDLGDGRFRFTLEMRHPWWGRTFHQAGVFDDPCPQGGPASSPHFTADPVLPLETLA